jgi:GDP-L-fucose synthase
MTNKPSVFVAGANGMVGRLIVKELEKRNYILKQNQSHCDFRNQAETKQLLKELEPDWVILAAAKVGGINANMSYPGQFIYDNIMIQTNIMHSAKECNVKKLLFLASSCVYPRLCPQPMKEKYLLSGPLESTNEAYAVAKIAGITLAKAYNQQYGTQFVSVLPPNLYGPGDSFDLDNSHVISALIRKMHEAKDLNEKSAEVWGSGKPKREFLYVDDLVDACIFIMEEYASTEILNIGSDTELTIAELAYIVRDIVGFEGNIIFDADRPDGMPAKKLDTSRLDLLGWKAKTPLRDGLESTYKYYLSIRDQLH